MGVEIVWPAAVDAMAECDGPNGGLQGRLALHRHQFVGVTVESSPRECLQGEELPYLARRPLGQKDRIRLLDKMMTQK
jgi:hypothetical protein